MAGSKSKADGAARPVAGLRLGPLEAQVMDVLWDNGPATVREVIEQLPSEPAYTTIATVLTNLDRKGLLAVERLGRSTRYGARTSRPEHSAALIEQVLRDSKDRSASILQFVEKMPDDELALLRDYLRQREEQTR